MARFAVIAVLASLWLAGLPGSGQPAEHETEALRAWQEVLSEAARTLDEAELGERQLSVIDARLKAVVEAAASAAAEARQRLPVVRVQLDALGPPPEPEAPKEASEIVALRDRLNEQFAQLDGRVKQAEVVAAHAQELLGRITAHRQRLVEQRLRRRGPTPLAGSTWSAAADAAGELLARLMAPAEEDPRIAGWRVGRPWLWLGTTALWGLLVFGWLRRKLLKRAVYVPNVPTPSYTRRVLVAAARGTANGLLPASVVLAAGFAVFQHPSLDPKWQLWVLAAGIAGAALVIAVALIHTTFAPGHPQWRIVPVRAEASRPLARRLDAAAAVFAVYLFLFILTQPWLPLDPALHSVSSLLLAVVLAALMISLLEPRLWRHAGPGGPTARFWPVLRPLLTMGLLALPALALLGFANLTDQFAAAILATGLIFGALLLLRMLLHEGLDLTFAPRRALAAPPRIGLVPASRRVHLGLVALIDAMLVLAGLVLGLITWGLPPAILGYWLSLLTQEVAIGEITISATRLLRAILIFAIVLVAFRWLRRLLAQRVFPNTGLDRGVQHSLAAVMGYLGLLFASIGALAVLGVDLSDLALIAGGLSIGIGFGLQNIAGNFVAGLILLAERPIKVGDWIRIGEFEGYVKRIKVRSTEIQTFQRADVIVPNSDLINNAVINWMHEDAYCRIEVRVGVAYDSDVDQVRNILQSCLQERPEIVDDPAPYVLYEDFGDSALIFEARGYIDDADQRLTATSDLRFAVHKALRAAAIEIPFPQRDLHIRSLDQTRQEPGEEDREDRAARRATSDAGGGRSSAAD